MDDADATRSQPPTIEPALATQPTSALDDAYVDEPEHYAVEGRIGEGGMGTVLAAKGTRLGRQVALKVVTIDRDDLRLRFERETRVTARLQHPAIVPVYGSGRGKSGHPFYVMKHVTGDPLDKAIAKATNLEKRIALLPSVIAVTEAIAYAHAESVIHRDLKPANILVGAFGETVVIDWGLAKDLAGSDDPVVAGPYRLSDSERTAHGKVMGTPSYMPLEQARGEAVDARADVYALGAILYHVLSGSAPYRREGEEGIPWATMHARVVSAPPPPLAQLQEGIPPDLLAIVARAMARTANERYSSAGELAADLKRFQTGQLVGAHRYSTWQLAKRWLRRHRAEVTVAAVLVAVLAVVSGLSVQRIRRERSDAEAARAIAETQRGLAVASRSEAEDLMGFMLGDLKDKLKPVGKLDILAAVANKTLTYYRHQAADANDDERRKRAQALFNVAEVFVPQGNLNGALDAYRTALEIRERLASAPASYADQVDAAVTHYKIGEVLDTRGDTNGALTEFRAGLALAERAASGEPGVLEPQFQVSMAHNELSDVELEQGDAKHAIDDLRTSQAIRDKLAAAEPGNPRWVRERAVVAHKLGTAFAANGELPEALAAAREAKALFEKATTLAPDNAAWRVDMGNVYGATGDVLLRQGKLADALAEYRGGLALAQQMASHDPMNTDWQRNIVVARISIGNALATADDHKGALVEFRASLEILETLVARDPANAQWRRDLMVGYQRISRSLGQAGDSAGAFAAAEKALALTEQLEKADPDNLTYVIDEGATHETIGNIHYSRESPAELAASIPEFEAALSAFEKLFAKQPTNLDFQRKVAIVYNDIGTSYAALGDPRVFDAFAKAMANYDAVVHAHPTDLDTLSDELIIHVNLSELAVTLHRGDPQAELRAAREIADRLVKEAPDNPQFKAYADEVSRREKLARGAKP